MAAKVCLILSIAPRNASVFMSLCMNARVHARSWQWQHVPLFQMEIYSCLWDSHRSPRLRVKEPATRRARWEEIYRRKTEIMLRRNKNVAHPNARIRNSVRKRGSKEEVAREDLAHGNLRDVMLLFYSNCELHTAVYENVLSIRIHLLSASSIVLSIKRKC